MDVLDANASRVKRVRIRNLPQRNALGDDA